MKTGFLLLSMTLLSSFALASTLAGGYRCHDTGFLFIEGGGDYPYANLDYTNGTSSPLTALKFDENNSKKGVMIQGFDESTLGTFQVVSEGPTLVLILNFTGAETLVCDKEK